MDKKALVEAALFVSDSPLTIDKLSKIVGIKREEVKKIIEEIKENFSKKHHGIELVETSEGFEFRVKQEYREKVAKLAPLADLTDGMVRTLALVVVKQPIKQSVIVKYQGNKVYGYIKKLEKKGLIKTEKYGRTKLVYTATGFEKYFGKTPEEVREMLRKKLEEV